MTDKSFFNIRGRSFFFSLLIAMLVLVIIVLGLHSVNDYNNTKQMFEKNSRHLKAQTEQDILITIKLTDQSYDLYDSSLNEQMHSGFKVVLAEYERSGRDPSAMNLTGIKKELGDQFDVYIINESGIIEFTTYEPELGLDFKTVPYFFAYLTRIRNSEGFFPDRIVGEQKGGGKLRKFAYMPTPDHRYVLELGFAKSTFQSELSVVDYREAIDLIASSNPYIERIRIFNTMGKIVDNTSEVVDDPTKVILEKVIQQRKDMTITIPENRQSVKYLFLDLKKEQYGSDASRIVEITYNDAILERAYEGHIQDLLFIAVLTLVIGICIAFLLSWYLSKPISQIVKDINRISGGDLDWKISPTNVAEFHELENSINTMVASLSDSIKEVKEGEILRREMIEQLPVAVFMKSVKDRKYLFWNKASEQIFNLRATEVIGRTDLELFSQKMVSTIEKEDSEARLNQLSISNKKITDKVRGQRIIHMIIVPIFDSTNSLQYILGIGEDVTEETLSMKIDLLFSITRRDILDQLSNIVNYLERAQLKTTREAMQTFFDKTLQSIESIRNQMSFVRSLQEIGITSPIWQPVKKVFWEAVMLFPSSTLDIRADMDDIELYADPLLPRVFYNLLSNSIHHGDYQLTKIRLYAQETGESLLLIYEDNGKGIPLDEKEKIFEFGFGTGTGFGLFLIRELLGYTGITIHETGEPGKGAKFEIVIPKGKFRIVK
ncbi:MAG TPA: ATP-binding protein [Methanoregula sp.]|nr:ATP-binding protein [Methanoregula sp.]